MNENGKDEHSTDIKNRLFAHKGLALIGSADIIGNAISAVSKTHITVHTGKIKNVATFPKTSRNSFCLARSGCGFINKTV